MRDTVSQSLKNHVPNPMFLIDGGIGIRLEEEKEKDYQYHHHEKRQIEAAGCASAVRRSSHLPPSGIIKLPDNILERTQNENK